MSIQHFPHPLQLSKLNIISLSTKQVTVLHFFYENNMYYIIYIRNKVKYTRKMFAKKKQVENLAKILPRSLEIMHD